MARGTLILLTALALLLQACTNTGKAVPPGLTPAEGSSTKVPVQTPPKAAEPPVTQAKPFCLAGYTLESGTARIASRDPQYGRYLGGLDVSPFYLSADGQQVDAIGARVWSLCTPDGKPLTSKVGELTRSEVKELLGEPTLVKSDGDEFWFYQQPGLDELLVVRCLAKEAFKADKAYIARPDVAKRLWYPLLGDPEGGYRPLELADSQLGTYKLDDNVINNPLGYSEGRTPPYYTLESKKDGVKLFGVGRLQAIWVRGQGALKTPRGIGIGGSAAEVEKAYGPARKGTDINGETYWSYESFRYDLGLVFEIVDQKVTAIYLNRTGFEVRPEVK